MMKKIIIFQLCLLATFQLNAQEISPVTTTICWDTSYSMFERNLEQEFQLLDKVFKRTPDQNVQLLLFSTDVTEHQFEIRNGDWSKIKEILIDVKADGATLYQELENHIRYNTVYFFTDGNSVLKNDLLPVKKGNFVINSNVDRDAAYLEKVTLLGRGRLMDLAAILPENLSEVKENKVDTKNITGTVYLDNEPAKDVEIRIKGSEKVINTDTNGKFAITAVPGDSILISSRENRTLKLLPIGYFDKDVDVFMESNVTQLEEVVVMEKLIATENKEVVNTATGIQDKENLGYAVQSIGDNQISEINTDVATAVSGRFSGVNLGTGQDLTKFSTRVNTSMLGNNYGLVVIDGTPIEQSNSSVYGGFNSSGSFIDPENIADITVLKGFAATNRYGTLGNNGVLLITTKNAKYGSESKELGSQVMAQNNVYDPTSEIKEMESPIMKALKASTSIQDAYEKYVQLRNFNAGNPSFFMDCFRYFKGKDNSLAIKILSNLWETSPESENAVKIMELSSRAVGNITLAETANRRLNELKPLALQPFFTEAQLAKEQGNWQNALDAWSVLSKGGNYGSLDVSSIQKSVDREIKNLILHKRTNLQISEIEEKYFKNEQMNVRLKLEWSDPKAEFHVQFVNPQNRYFNWEHTSDSDSKRIQEEIELGYSMEEFEVYDDLKGAWQININYLGNLDGNSTLPLVLLCSKYTDFGLPTQKRELIWLFLDNQNPRKKMVQFRI